MTEIKWSILFTALFLVLAFGLEYEILLTEGLINTKIQYNLQLDTCLSDTLRSSELGRRGGAFFFYRPDRVQKELKKQLAFVWPSLYGKGSNAEDGGIALLILYEPDGFYFYAPGMKETSAKTVFQEEGGEERLLQLEAFMEEQLRKQFVSEGKKGRLCFTFPKEERAAYAQTVKGTGLLLVYEAEAACFRGRPYERFILSGARVETVLK